MMTNTNTIFAEFNNYMNNNRFTETAFFGMDVKEINSVYVGFIEFCKEHGWEVSETPKEGLVENGPLYTSPEVAEWALLKEPCNSFQRLEVLPSVSSEKAKYFALWEEYKESHKDEYVYPNKHIVFGEFCKQTFGSAFTAGFAENYGYGTRWAIGFLSDDNINECLHSGWKRLIINKYFVRKNGQKESGDYLIKNSILEYFDISDVKGPNWDSPHDIEVSLK